MELGVDPYAVLGVGMLAGDDQIHRAYRSLARTWHPDANPGDTDAAARFAELTAAYELLHDPVRRRTYDLARAAAHGPRPVRSAPAPTGDVTVRGPQARPAHRPRSVDREPDKPERDEFALLGLVAKILAALVVVFLVLVVFASLNQAPECGAGVNPAFCRPAASPTP